MLPGEVSMQACKGLRSLSIAGPRTRMKELLLIWTLLPCGTHLALSDGPFPGLLLIDHEHLNASQVSASSLLWWECGSSNGNTGQCPYKSVLQVLCNFGTACRSYLALVYEPHAASVWPAATASAWCLVLPLRPL